jgi:hypothetical protein
MPVGYSATKLVPAVSERLGHANTGITLSIYSHVMPKDDAAIAAALDTGLAAIVPPANRLGPVLVPRSATEPIRKVDVS